MEQQQKGRVFYQDPAYKPEKREQANFRLPQSTKDQIKALVASKRYESEADAIIAAVHALMLDQPTIEQRAQVVRDALQQQANDLYWSYQDADTMPQAEYNFYTWLMKIDEGLDQFIPSPSDPD